MEIFLQAPSRLCAHCIAEKPTQYRVCTHNTTLTLILFGWIADQVVKIVVPLITAYMELKEISPLLFLHFNILLVFSPTF